MKLNYTCKNCGHYDFSGLDLDGTFDVKDYQVSCSKCGKFTTLNYKSGDEIDEGSFNWKTACLYWGIILFEVLLVVGVVWGIVLLV